MKGVYVLNIEALSHTGKVRKLNEDSYGVYTCDEYLFAVVADGMGGHQAGEVASKMAVDIIEEYIVTNMDRELDKFQVKELILNAFRKANEEIYNYSCENKSVMGMGTTTTLCMLRDGYIIYAHVGDSRAYLIDKKITQITRDHSYVQELVKLGQITPEEAKRHPRRNYITRAMGVEDSVKADAGIKTYHGEKILICSDGLHGEVEDCDILEIVRNNSAKDGAKMLINLANENGGADNITAIIIEGEADNV